MLFIFNDNFQQKRESFLLLLEYLNYIIRAYAVMSLLRKEIKLLEDYVIPH